MIRAFRCDCGEYDFVILTENTKDTNYEDKTYFRCSECGKDYQWEDVNKI